MITKVSCLTFTLFILYSSTIYGQNTHSEQLTVNEVNEFKSLFLQMAVLLGMAIIVFIYVNLRSNKSKRKPTEKLKLNHLSNQTTQKSVTNLQRVVDLIPYAACMVNRDGIPQFFNEQFEQLTQQSFKQILSQHWKNLLNLQPEEISNSTLSSKNSVLYKTLDDHLLKITQTPIRHEGQDELQSIVIEDVTYLETKMETLSERIKYFRYVINQSTSAIFITDITGSILEINDNACEFTNMTFDALKQENIHDFIPPSFQSEFHDQINKSTLSNHKCQLIEYTFIIGDKTIPVDINLGTIDYFGTKANIIIIKDVSDRVKHEQRLILAQKKAEESDRLKSNFLANMSHEVRTPMNSVMGFSELMCDSQLSDNERREFHQIVKNSAQELLNLLDDIIEFSKIESGQIQLKNDALNPDQLLQNLKSHTFELLKNKSDINFSISAPIGISEPPLIFSDFGRITQILRHLLDNAVKFTYSGTITLGYYYRPDGSIDLFVKDTGIGIPQAKISKIFHKFRQADEANNRGFGGAGLGLSMSQQLARHMNGFLWVESQEQIGSTFHLIIPPKVTNQEGDIRDIKTILYYQPESKNHELPVIKTSGHLQIIPIFKEEELQNIPIANSIAGIVLKTKPNQETLDKLFEIINYPRIALFNPTKQLIEDPVKNKFQTLSDVEELNIFFTYCQQDK